MHKEYTYDRQGNILFDSTRSFAYDAMNRLSQVINEEVGTQKNRYDGEGLRAEMEEKGRLATFLFDGDKVVAETESDGNVIRYIRGYELVSSDSEKARTYYHYTFDELGSITHVTNGDDTYYGDGLNLYSYYQNNPVRYVDPSGHNGMCPEKEAAIKKMMEEGTTEKEAKKCYESLRKGYREYDLVPYDNRKYKTPGFETHHGILNEWAEHNIPGYTKKMHQPYCYLLKLMNLQKSL